MRRDAVLDLLLLEADGGLSPVDAVRLEEALALDPALRAERAPMRAAWRELQILGSEVAMAHLSDEAGSDAPRESEAPVAELTLVRRAPVSRAQSPAPARRRRRSPRKRR